MPEITLPFEFQPNTTASATEVMANFNVIVNTINGNLEAVNLADNSVAAGQLQNSAVTAAKLADGAVTYSKIANSAVDTQHLYGNAVTTDKLGTAAVTTGKIADGAVIAQKLSNLAVTEAKIAAQAVTANKIAPNSVTMDKMGPWADYLPSDLRIHWLRVSSSGSDLNTSGHPASWVITQNFNSTNNVRTFTITHNGVECSESSVVLTSPYTNEGVLENVHWTQVYDETATSFKVDVVGSNSGFKAIIYTRAV